MNRTRTWPGAISPGPQGPSFSIDSALFESSDRDAPHTLFAPLHYEPGYSYPLIVWLHGSSGDERHLLRVMPLISMRNYVAVAPRGTADSGLGKGFLWPAGENFVARSETAVSQCIHAARSKLNVAAHRIFIAGFDCGGTMALRVAFNRPDLFAGALSLGGSLPSGCAVLRNLAVARRLPIFLATGRHSAEYPSTQVCQDLRLLHSAGMSVTLREYPCGHELSPQMLSDVDRWIIEQITTPADAVAR
jgi:phospholipase/carboxylesterase